MYIAQNKRRENIAEYILYLWQLEDLLRALHFSPEAIFSQLIAPRKLPAEQQEELLVWYMEIVALLREQKSEESGHLDHTLHLISDMNDLHLQLTELPVGAKYRAILSNLTPSLPILRKTMGASERIEAAEQISDIELCFRALYAVMLYRIRGGSEQSKSAKIVEDVTQLISPLIAELAKVFHQVEAGEIDLFESVRD